MLMYYIYLRKKDFCPWLQEFKEGFSLWLKEGLRNLRKVLVAKINFKFYNTLTNRVISDKYHEYVLNVWKAFKINTMK